MIRRRLQHLALTSVLAVLVFLPRGLTAEQAPAAAGSKPPEVALLQRYAPAVVTVRVVLRTELQVGGQGQNQETTVDTTGFVVDPGGLIMLWNSQISSSRLMDIFRQTGMMPDDFDLKMTPTDFKVLFEGESEPRRAFLAASDSDLDLAFLQLEEPGDKPLPAVDFSSTAEPTPGQEVVAVARLNSSFDSAAYFERGQVAGKVRKPRPAWVVNGQFSALGMPLFALDGTPVGVLSTVLSTVDTQTSGGGGLENMLGMLTSRRTLGPLGVFLLPPHEVARAIERSKARAAQLLEERAGADEKGKTESEKSGKEGGQAQDTSKTGGGDDR